MRIEENVKMPGREFIEHLQRCLSSFISAITDKHPALLWEQARAFEKRSGYTFRPTIGVR